MPFLSELKCLDSIDSWAIGKRLLMVFLREEFKALAK